MAIDGLLKEGLVEWINSMTYHAASGAGAANMKELLTQMGSIYESVRDELDQNKSILDIDSKIKTRLSSDQFPTQEFGYPLAASLLPWIDTDLGNGVSREEWKGGVEANKILGNPAHGEPGSVLVEGICVRVGVMRCHSQALTFRLKKEMSLKEIESIIKSGNQWVHWVDNNKEDTLKYLTPAFVSGSLSVAIGRLKASLIDKQTFSAFTVGDQLLWGAAEPLRRMLRILL
jgi:aspartate-semialdehyde dehydrogenase